MSARRSSAALLLGALIASAGALGQGANPFGISAFSATMVMTMPGGRSLSTKIYVLAGKVRTDLPGGGAGGGYSLVLSQAQEAYMVMAGHCMMMPFKSTRPNPFTMKGSVKTEQLGSDTVDGHPTTIVELTLRDAAGHTTKMKAWRATDLQQFPLRVEIPTSNGTVREEFHDLSLTPPAADLFERPSNCMSMPSFGAPH
ncbi:MAG TPA: hypothetical protein VMD03_07515 [Steroidobacteraceae bacterium]|nr:hypothetical protein [Steroidobacteraceae bacterium]